MRTVTTIAELRAVTSQQRRDGVTVGFVPTMGYFHDGHLSLIETAARDNGFVVTSLFVNPLQFAATEDLGVYPRDLEGDTARADAAGSDVLFIPGVDEMYPDGPTTVLTTVAVPALAEIMEGASRPSHFAGVCTVVAKLFSIVGPCSAYFGEKDYQQLAIVRRMARDLSMPVRVVGCPTIREDDGLAMSSRNVYLSTEERRVAPVLNQALRLGADLIRSGETDRDVVIAAMTRHVEDAGSAIVDYFEVADPLTLTAVDRVGLDSRLFGAIRFQRARLIDNVAVIDATGGCDDSAGGPAGASPTVDSAAAKHLAADSPAAKSPITGPLTNPTHVDG